MDIDNLDDHPDLRDLRLSKKDEREARAEWRRRQRQVVGPSREPSFLRRHRVAVVSIVALAVLLVVSAVLADRNRLSVTEMSPPNTDRPSVDLSRPFAGTPTEGWGDGAAGIVPPAAAPVGTYSAEQVAAAYQRVRQVLITARLNPAVLEEHDHEPYLALLAPSARATATRDLAQPSRVGYALATRIADGFHLLPATPKVMGEMWAEQAPDGALTVHTNYVFAYAFAPSAPDRLNDLMDIVTVDRFEADYTITDERWPETDRGLSPGPVRGYGYSIACDAYQRGELAPSYSGQRQPPDPDDGLDATAAFDLEYPLPTTSSCPG
ncbi:hypothetical protein [Actinophytocola sp.]|uniref:hypothetical protein n=1 Tax=Actinophytocola sp. TaxID=1872138 RepID=UPI002ED4713C